MVETSVMNQRIRKQQVKSLGVIDFLRFYSCHIAALTTRLKLPEIFYIDFINIGPMWCQNYEGLDKSS
jgi:hypothetical protein